MTDTNPDDTVVISDSARGIGRGIYHYPGEGTPTECWPRLNHCDASLTEVRRGDLRGNMRPCKYCSGEFASSGPASQLESKLLELDPEDVGLSPVGDRGGGTA